jgi:hypothetical protein
MTEPSAPRPVPGPPSAGAGPAVARDLQTPDADLAGQPPFAELDERPVAEHVAVYEAEHSRLQRELGTIDQL